jgi:ABC-type oligopeptide transport system substrate-binding subunit
LGAILAVFALIVAACGGDDTDPSTTADGGTDATTTVAPGTTVPGATTTPPTTVEEMVTTLSGLTVVDDTTFTVELTTPDPEFPLRLAYAAYFPLPSVAYDDPVAFEDAPVGNGPFMMSGTWEHDVQVSVTAYPDYAGPDQPQVGNITFQIYADVVTAYNDALAGNLDIVTLVPTDFLGTYQDDFPDSNAEFNTTSFTYLGFPSYLPEYTADHRRALSMAFDRQLIMDQIFLGARDPAFSVIPPNLQGRDTVCDYWGYDPAAAKVLWDQAQAAAPLEDITVWFNSGADHETWIQAIVNQWATNLGIDPGSVTFESLEFSEYLPLLDSQGVTGPYRLGWGQDYPSPFNFLDPLYASHSFPPVGSNNFFYSNPDFDAALQAGAEKVAASGQLEDGLADYYAAEDILCNDVPVMPILFGKAQVVWGEGTDNVFFDSYADLGYTKVTADDDLVTLDINEPEHLFPTTTNESEGIQVLRALFTGLVQYDAETNEPFNANAASITSEDGGKTWTIVLNEGWTFHDGEAVTAESYVNAWNYGAYGANGQQNNSFYANIVGYAEINPETEG